MHLAYPKIDRKISTLIGRRRYGSPPRSKDASLLSKPRRDVILNPKTGDCEPKHKPLARRPITETPFVAPSPRPQAFRKKRLDESSRHNAFDVGISIGISPDWQITMVRSCLSLPSRVQVVEGAYLSTSVERTHVIHGDQHDDADGSQPQDRE